MTAELRQRITTALKLDKNRNKEHQQTCGLRLTQEQMDYLTEQRKKFGIGRGAYMRRLLIIDMEKRKSIVEK